MPTSRDQSACHRRLAPVQLGQRRRGVGEPKGHRHRPILLDGGGQVGASLGAASDHGIKPAEAKVAMGLERAHAQFLGQGEGLTEVGFGFFDMRGFATCGTLAEEAQGIGLVAPFLALTGECQRALGKGVRLPQAASQQVHFP